MPSLNPSDLAAWSRGTWDPHPPASIEGVSNDTRTITHGCLYVAIRGERFDGHAFVADALAKGASGAVVSRAWVPGKAGIGPLLRVEDTAKALRAMAAGYRCQVAPEIVAVSGSAGKSTVKEMTAQVLSRAMPVASTKGNWNNDIGLPLSLLGMDASIRTGVFEIGTNHPGELAVLCDLLKPDWGILTNVGPVHVEFFGTLEAIADEKADLLRCLPRHGVAVLNADDRFYDFLRSVTQARVITVSTQKGRPSDYVLLGRTSGTGEATVEEKASGEQLRVRLPVAGEHNAVNAMLAVAVARGHGLSWDMIGAALESFVPLPMRWERMLIAGVSIINDAYNANPLSMRASIGTFEEERTSGRKWLVLGGMLELGANQDGEHVELGRYAGRGPWDGIIAVGPLGGRIAEGVEQAGCPAKRLFRCVDNRAATAILKDYARAGDLVLLKASRGIHLEEIVSSLVSERGG